MLCGYHSPGKDVNLWKLMKNWKPSKVAKCGCHHFFCINLQSNGSLILSRAEFFPSFLIFWQYIRLTSPGKKPRQYTVVHYKQQKNLVIDIWVLLFKTPSCPNVLSLRTVSFWNRSMWTSHYIGSFLLAQLRSGGYEVVRIV